MSEPKRSQLSVRKTWMPQTVRSKESSWTVALITSHRALTCIVQLGRRFVAGIRHLVAEGRCTRRLPWRAAATVDLVAQPALLAQLKLRPLHAALAGMVGDESDVKFMLKINSGALEYLMPAGFTYGQFCIRQAAQYEVPSSVIVMMSSLTCCGTTAS